MPSDQFDDSSTISATPDNHQQPHTMSKPSPKILSLILRAIIMSLLTSVFFLFLGVAAIFLTHLFLAGRHLNRHRRRQFRFSPDSPPNGMTSEDLHHLPGFRFGEGSQLDCGSDCVICLDRIGEGDLFRTLPGCGHAFHLDCIDTWLVKTPACPICRARVFAGGEVGGDDDCKQLWTIRA